MDEFSLINKYFGSIRIKRPDVILGIGDDAASLRVPNGMDLLVTTDTLVSGVHFLQKWDAYDIASRAVRVNVSDIVAMGGVPSWATLALTIPVVDPIWLERFSRGLADTLRSFGVALVGGNTARGPLSVTLTMHGLVPHGQSVTRGGAKKGDKIYVSGTLGAAALAVASLEDKTIVDEDRDILMHKLLRPNPRVDLVPLLQLYASACIDLSDGLLADLNHMMQASTLGARLMLNNLPIHPLVSQYAGDRAMNLAIGSGDDYELCFTVPIEKEREFKHVLSVQSIRCTCIGEMESTFGLRDEHGVAIDITGYRHF